MVEKHNGSYLVHHEVAVISYSECCLEACCFDSGSVMSDGEEKVPTGGELTLFEAVGPGRA